MTTLQAQRVEEERLSWWQRVMETPAHRASRLRREKACQTPGVVYGVALRTPNVISITLRFPFSVEDKVSGRSAVTEGSRLERYDQMFWERQRFDDAIHDALEPVLAREFFSAPSDDR